MGIRWARETHELCYSPEPSLADVPCQRKIARKLPRRTRNAQSYSLSGPWACPRSRQATRTRDWTRATSCIVPPVVSASCHRRRCRKNLKEIRDLFLAEG